MRHPNYWDTLVVSIFQKRAMEHTISGMFNLIFWQKERLSSFGFEVLFVCFCCCCGVLGFFLFSPWGDILWCIFFSLCTGLNHPLKKNWKIAHWPLVIWVGSQISIPKCMDCVQSACGSELWISHFWGGQPSAGTTGCPAEALPLNVACAVQEQRWDLRSGSLWEGLLRPRKPNNIAVVWAGVRMVGF